MMPAQPYPPAQPAAVLNQADHVHMTWGGQYMMMGPEQAMPPPGAESQPAHEHVHAMKLPADHDRSWVLASKDGYTNEDHRPAGKDRDYEAEESRNDEDAPNDITDYADDAPPCGPGPPPIPHRHISAPALPRRAYEFNDQHLVSMRHSIERKPLSL